MFGGRGRGAPPQGMPMGRGPAGPMGGGMGAGRPPMPAQAQGVPQRGPMPAAPAQAMQGRPPMPMGPAGGIGAIPQNPMVPQRQGALAQQPMQAAGAPRQFKKGGSVFETSAKDKAMDKKHGFKEGSKREEAMDARGYGKPKAANKYAKGGLVKKGGNSRRARKGMCD